MRSSLVTRGLVLGWLLEGDPAIRWQAMRDLCRAPEPEWQAERRRIPTEGWGKQFLEALLPDGSWPEGRWTGTVWTLLTIMDVGVPPDHARIQAAAFGFLSRNLTAERARDASWLLTRMDLCHLGFWLRAGAYFGFDRERLASLADTIFQVQLTDGGWNCRIRTNPKTTHSSFHTTFNVLEGLREAASAGIIEAATFRAGEARALEFMLAHQMYRSDRTGEVVNERFTHLTFPSHWHYTVLRGLDYMHRCPEIADPRLADPIVLIERRCKPSGRWPVEKRIPGSTLFEMERLGSDSRWNTLRALRVLAARSGGW